MRAAEAVEAALQQSSGHVETRHIDVLTLANRAFRKVYGRWYLDAAKRAPHLLGYVYDWLDRPKERKGELEPDALRVAVEKLNMQPFLKLLKSETWDIVVNTHFLPAEIIASLRGSGGTAPPQVTVTTDFMTHRLWVQEPCDHYFTATEEGAVYLQSWGVAPKRITVSGIPIDPVFCRRKSRRDCRAAHGLAETRTAVLILSGGFGIGPIEEILRGVLTLGVALEVAVVCGRNPDLPQLLADISCPPRHHLTIVGCTPDIDELMAAADVVITKPGGLTSAEALARGCAIAIVNPIPGQESRNSDYLLENGAAIKIGPIVTLPHRLGGLLNDPLRLAQLKSRARRLARPRAAFTVAETVLALIDETLSRTPAR